MGNDPSSMLAVGSATNRANKMLDNLAGTGNDEKGSSSEKMKSIKKQQTDDAVERKKRLADRQKE